MVGRTERSVSSNIWSGSDDANTNGVIHIYLRSLFGGFLRLDQLFRLELILIQTIWFRYETKHIDPKSLDYSTSINRICQTNTPMVWIKDLLEGDIDRQNWLQKTKKKKKIRKRLNNRCGILFALFQINFNAKFHKFL